MVRAPHEGGRFNVQRPPKLSPSSLQTAGEKIPSHEYVHAFCIIDRYESHRMKSVLCLAPTISTSADGHRKRWTCTLTSTWSIREAERRPRISPAVSWNGAGDHPQAV